MSAATLHEATPRRHSRAFRGGLWARRWFAWPFLLLAGLGAATFVVAPMAAEAQLWLALGGVLVFLLTRRLRGRGVTIFLVLVSCLISARYIHWRLVETLDFTSFTQTFLGTGLLLAEIYAVSTMMLAYLQAIWPLDRKPVPLPDDPESWPTVDILIPTYNESLTVVKPSVYAALALDWPRHKLNVYLLDDGRRDEFRRFAEQVGCHYLVRADNRGAKAGNINAALARTSGEFVVVFDCDHVPTRAFLQFTMGWMLRDADLAMVQTPHHFYSPDPFERNLASGERVPNEGLLFYGLVQQGNDLWNAAFFCGSCAVLRREALLEVGGVPTQTVTEDCHCSLRMQRLGWRTAYLRLPLAAGLATERLLLHIGQRMRWARGMVQIMRIDNPLFGPGLRLGQRLCYFMAQFHFLFPLPRLVFLTAPLAYLLLGENVIAASPLAIIAYAGPHILHSIGTTSRLSGKVRHSFWSEIYETVLALWLVPVTLATLLDPRRGRFNVTNKGGTLDEGFFDLRAVGPNLLLALALLAGLLAGVRGLALNPPESLDFQAHALNAGWALLSFVVVLAGLAVGRERRQVRERARIAAVMPVRVRLPDGSSLEGSTIDLSLGGAALALDRLAMVPEEAAIDAEFDIGPEWVTIPAVVMRWRDGRLQLRFTPQTLHDEGSIVRVVLCRADAWMDWDEVTEDRPLHSLGEVARSIGGLFRGDSQLARLVGRRRGLTPPAPAGTPPEPPSAELGPGVSSPRAAARRRGEGNMRRAAALLLAAMLALPGLAFAQGAGPRGAVPGRPAASAPPPAALLPAGEAAAPAVPPAEAPAGALPLIPLPSLGPAAAGPPGALPGAAPGAEPAPLPAATPPRESARSELLTLRELGLRGPMQMRGSSDLQGVLFGVRGDEVVTSARLTLQGALSPALLPDYSQIAVTLNEQFIGVINPDRSRPAFGPIEFPVNPVFFADLNRLNLRFTGRYTAECNDPLSGLLWANISDLSTLQLEYERLPLPRDLARLPEPFFDPRLLRTPLVLPVVLPESASNDTLKAAAIAATWFAVQADYRGASFPAGFALPPRGNAVLVAAGNEAPPGVSLPRFEGPTLALLPHPSDPYGMLLVIGGRNAAEAVQAAQVLASRREALSGESALVRPISLPPRQPYDAPRWVRSDRPVRFGELVDPSELQAFGYSPGPISIPFRTAPDLYTWRNRPLPVEIHYRAPPGPIMDVSVSRLDAALNDVYLRSLPLREPEPPWPLNLLARRLTDTDRQDTRFGLPPWLVFGMNELQLRFDMRPMHRGDCVAVPSDVRASIDPDSTIDLSGAYRFAVLPNLAHFTGAGFPFSRLADFAETAVVLPERPVATELTVFLTLMGRLAAQVGHAATAIEVVRSPAVETVAGRDLLLIGAIGRQPALTALLREGPVQVDGNRLSVALPDALEGFRHLFGGEARRQAREAATALLAAPGEGLAALIGFESPLRPGRSVVAFTGTSTPALETLLATLRDPEEASKVQGDLALLSGGRFRSFALGNTYTVGTLPPHLWPQYYLADRPETLVLLLVAACAILAIPIYWTLRRRAALRLRTRTP